MYSRLLAIKSNVNPETDMLEPIVKTIDVPCSCEHAFKTFIENTASWWPLDKNSVSAMNGAVAKSVSIEAKEDGRIVEIGHDDTEHHWGTVTQYNPYTNFTMDWHIGMASESPSEVSVVFTDLGDGNTRVELTHSRWESFGDKAEDMRNGYNAGWAGVFEEAFKNGCAS